MREEDSDFSSLRTVSTFDKGDSSTVAMGVEPQDLRRFSPPSLFVESLLEQLCKLFEKDSRRQKKLYLTLCQKLHQMNLIDGSYKIEEFQFMRSHYQKALYHFLTVAKATIVENKAIYPNTSPQLSISPGSILEWSRYATEFEELEFIAKGGFGHVFKSQHKLDGEIYAIKKIYIRSHNVDSFLNNLREVKMLAKLNHPNIVAYKAAWLEPIEHQETKPALVQNRKSSSNDESVEIVFENSDKEKESVKKSGNFEIERSERSSSEWSQSVSNKDGIMCEVRKTKYQFNYTRSVRVSQYATLYIQMQLCQTTMRQWLDIRNNNSDPVNITLCIDIFKQVIKGVEYIHSQGIVHHDIKPSNIFVSEDLRQVQVGDFGLACCLVTHSNSSVIVYPSHQPGYAGTKLYAAPEQLRNICDPKSDVYSLGIILLELIKPCQTAMERSKVIGQLKLGQLPTDITASWPHLARIISQTCTSNLKKRPSSTELRISLEETESINTMRIIEEQEATIQELRKENLAKDEEIAVLRRQLQDMIDQKTKCDIETS